MVSVMDTLALTCKISRSSVAPELQGDHSVFEALKSTGTRSL